jgi:thiamine-phosphate diphosphorylase
VTTEGSDDVILSRVSEAAQRVISEIPSFFSSGYSIRLGYARKKPSGAQDVAALPPAPYCRDNGQYMVPGPLFGADLDIARDIITVMRFDPGIRSIGAIPFHPDLEEVCEEMMLDVGRYDPSRVSPSISTMNWGFASCCKDGVPDVIYATGIGGRDEWMYFLSEDPGGVATNILMCIARIHTTPL